MENNIKKKRSCLSHVQLFVTPWTVAHQASLYMGFSKQEHWSGLPCPPPEYLPNPGIKPTSLMSPALAVGFLPLVPPGISIHLHINIYKTDLLCCTAEINTTL